MDAIPQGRRIGKGPLPAELIAQGHHHLAGDTHVLEEILLLGLDLDEEAITEVVRICLRS